MFVGLEFGINKTKITSLCKSKSRRLICFFCKIIVML